MRIRFYGLAVFVLGCAGLAVSLAVYPPETLSTVLFLGALAFVAEWLALSLPAGGTISLAFSMHLAGVLLGGPATGALVALMSSVPPQDIRERRPWYRIAFNMGQFMFSTAVSGFVFLALGGAPLGAGFTVSSLGLWVGTALAAALAQAAMNIALVGGAIAINERQSLLSIWAAMLRSFAVSMVALTLLGIIMAVLISLAGAVSSLLLAIPFFVSRQTLRSYQQLSEAYKDTLRSLVTLIEAKDPYTRGHSERVAVYAREIAHAIGMTSTDAHAVEYAALLHDVGKVGVAAVTLTKPGALTAEEYDEVKLHPVTAARVLADVELLEDTLPLIEAHHERLDGSGYPYGLANGAIPLGAQVLAVADSYDAMTSTRSYRPAMPPTDALRELERESGVRLEGECVQVLKEAIRSGVFAELHVTGYDWEAESS